VTLLKNIRKIVDQRVVYLEQCRVTFKKHVEQAETKIDDYIENIISELRKI
jgi:hypothetical protein